MPYIAQKPLRGTASSAELRNRIEGWGIDLGRERRPAVPKEHFIGRRTGAHWEFPELQPERVPREHTLEQDSLPPVFGTACPLRGVSGMIRRYAYTLSEGRLGHWLLLAGADRVDVVEARIAAMLRGNPDDLIAESGIVSELKRNGWKARRDGHRADVKHQPIDAIARGAAVLTWLPLVPVGRLLRPLAARSRRAAHTRAA